MNDIRKKLLAWLGHQEGNYIFQKCNFLTHGERHRVFNGYVIVSKNIFKAFQSPFAPSIVSIDLEFKDKIFTFSLDYIDDVNDDFLVVSQKNANLAQCYLHYKILKDELSYEKYSSSDEDRIIVFKVGAKIKDIDGKQYTLRSAKKELEIYKNYLVQNSIK